MIAILKRKYNNLISDKKFFEILVGSAFAVVAHVTSVALSFASSIVVARFYGAETMGVLAIINSFLIMVTIFTVLGTGTSILRLIPEHIARHSVSSAFLVYRKTQYFVAAISVATGIVFFLVSGLVAANVFSKPHLSFFFALASGFVVFKALMDLNTQAVRGLKLVRTFAFMQVMPSATMLTVLIAGTLFFHNPNIPIPVFSQLTAFAVTALAGVWTMNRAFRNRMRTDDVVQPVPVRDILSLSMPMLLTASMLFLVGQTGIIMLGMFRTESEVGYYSVAVKLATLTAFVLQAINTIAAPKFSELYHTHRIDELFHVARKSTKLIFWTTVPILLFLVVLGKPILAIMFGKDFVVAYPAMVLLVIGQFVNSISGATGNFLNMTGHQKALRNVMFIAALINIALSLALIPRYGINGAAIGGMVSLSLLNIYTIVYIKNKFGSTIGYVPIFK